MCTCLAISTMYLCDKAVQSLINIYHDVLYKLCSVEVAISLVSRELWKSLTAKRANTGQAESTRKFQESQCGDVQLGIMQPSMLCVRLSKTI